MPSVRREVVLPVPRDRAWELLTDPDELREWLDDDVEMDAEVGGEVRAGDHEGVVECVEAGRRLAFRWDDGGAPSHVEWTLDDHPGGTRVTVVERRPAPVVFTQPGVSTWGPRLQALARASALCPA
jgi:uncharacterized protein YndB with AHSA1/START domain